MIRQANLGYFAGFMQAWPTVPAETHAQLYTEALEYEANLIDPKTFVDDVSAALGIPPPTGY